jgi:kynurenine formamidase
MAEYPCFNRYFSRKICLRSTNNKRKSPMRWKNRPEGSNWGDFGPDDQRGKMNLITPERRLAGMREVKEGIAFTLSLPLDYPGGISSGSRRKPPQLFAVKLADSDSYNCLGDFFCPGSNGVNCDDGVILYTQYSTQWDSFAHWGRLFDADGDGIPEKVFYNGFRAGEDVVAPDQDDGPHARRLGIENLAEACPQSRAALVNLFAIHGHKPVAYGYDDLMYAFDAQKVEVESGDFLLLYTGVDALLLGMNKQPDRARLMAMSGGLDGHDDRLLKWIDDSGVVGLCSDNMTVEIYNPKIGRDDATGLRLHEHCLFKLGIHLGELWYLKELAEWLKAHQRSAFLLTAPPLRLPGAVGSPACPIATV